MKINSCFYFSLNEILARFEEELEGKGMYIFDLKVSAVPSNHLATLEHCDREMGGENTTPPRPPPTIFVERDIIKM